MSSGNSEIRIVLSLPHKDLSPNARPHWTKKAKLTASYREQAWALTLAAGGHGLRWEKAMAQATFYWPDCRRRDIRNAEHSIKAAYDGIVDAGLIVDDSAKVLTHDATEFKVDPQHPRVEIVIRRIV